MPRPVLHLIPQAHLDPVWLWPWRDGAAEALTTLQSAVDRAREFPSFTFTRSSASLYRWVAEQDPRLFEDIRALVVAGRWEVVGGWVEQPDCNFPSAESFVRQALLGRAWLRAHLGPKAVTTIGYNVDSFGHHGGLPQLLRQTGCRHYVFMRPEAVEAPEIADLFWWEGTDGSRVLAQRVPSTYSQAPDTTADQLEQTLRDSWKRHFAQGSRHGVFWLGVGNHGGGPTRDHLQRVLALQKDPTLPELRLSSLSAYFSAIEASALRRRLPVHRGELQHRFRGCYAATASVKRDHRRCELLLRTTEALVALPHGGVAPGPVDRAQLADLSWQLADLQFHDILAGTCAHSVQTENRDRLGAVASGLDRMRVRAVHQRARRVDTRGVGGSVLFVHNPLPWARRALVQLDTFSDPHRRGPLTHLIAPDGTVVPLQWAEADAAFGPWLMPWGKLTARVELPPGGHRVFTLGTGAVVTPAPPASSSIPDLRLVIHRDPHDTWGHSVKRYDDPLGEARLTADKVIEEGPYLRVLRRAYRWKRSRLWIDLREDRQTGDLELRLRIDWRERRQLCRLELASGLDPTAFVTKTAGGAELRPHDGTEQPGLEWCTLTGRNAKGRETTVLIAADTCHGWSAQGGTLRCVVARGTPFAEHPPITVSASRPEPFTDEGWQEQRFWLRRAPGNWAELAPDRFAAEQLVAPEAMLDNAHPGDLPRELAGWRLTPDHVSLLAAKPAEDGDGLILRVQEMSGRRTTASLTHADGPSARLALRPWQMRSLRLSPTQSTLVECDALEQRLS